MKHILILFIVSLSLSSCGTYRINNTLSFGKIKELSELNGTYQNQLYNREKSRYNILYLFGCLKCLDENIDTALVIQKSIDSVTIQFPDDTTLLVSYLVNDTILSKEFKGKKKRKFFEIYFRKDQFFIPFILGSIDVRRARIGRYKKTNDLHIRYLDQRAGWLFFLSGGADDMFGYEASLVHKRIGE
jgi:hypothetical protein